MKNEGLSGGSYKWWLLAFLFVTFFLEQASRQIYNAALPQIKIDFASFGVTNTQLGVVGSVFGAVFGLALVGSGIAADFIGRKRTLVAGTILFSVGGPLMGKCIAGMNMLGRWISLASMAGPETTIDVNLLWRKNLRIIGSTLRRRSPEEKTQILQGLVDEVWPAFEARKFAPFIHKVMPIAEVTEAQAILERGENRGKVVLLLH